MTITIDPCPFCGAKEHDYYDGLVDGMIGDHTIFVRCLKCGADGPHAPYVVDAKHVITSWPEAVRLWNSRFPDPEWSVL